MGVQAMALISQTSEYALRATVYLAARSDPRPASAQEIADAVRSPMGYLQKILRMLAKSGILVAQRGVGGGFALAIKPEEISILDVLRASETQIARIDRCPLGVEGHAGLCPLHRLIDSEIARIEKTFASTTIGSLLDGEGGVRPLCDSAGRYPVSVELTGPKRATNRRGGPRSGASAGKAGR